MTQTILNMNKLLIFVLGLSTLLQAQKKNISLEDIWKNNTFRSDYMNSLNSMNGDFYSLIDFDGFSSSVNKYSYETLEKIETIAGRPARRAEGV